LTSAALKFAGYPLVPGASQALTLGGVVIGKALYVFFYEP
jgi:hypothetical protein